MDDGGRRRRARQLFEKRKTEPTNEMKPTILIKLARTPWVLRQIAKATAYVGTAATALLDKAVVNVNGQTIDFFSPENTAAIAALLVTVLAAGVEALLSYAAARFGQAES